VVVNRITRRTGLSHNSEEHHVLQDEPGIGDLSKVLTTTFSAASHIFSTFASDKPLMLHKLCTNKPDSQCATFCQGRVGIMRSELGATMKTGKNKYGEVTSDNGRSIQGNDAAT